MDRSDARPAGRARILLFLVVAALLGAGAPARAQSSLTDVVEAISPSVVTVSVLFSKSSTRRARDVPGAVRIVRPGSGVIVDPTGLVLTNLHLVAEVLDADGAPSTDFWALVSLPNGRQHPATVVARDERTDLALLRINAGSTRLPALPLGHPQTLAQGERVLAVSFAGGEANNVFAGVLAFPGGPTRLRDGELSREETLLTDARFHYSLDGGPLVDMRGRVLGLHNSSHVASRGIGFQEEEEDATKKGDDDYAVIVSADAIRAVFDEWLPADAAPPAPLESEIPSEAIAPIAAIAPSVVSVWTGSEGPHPSLPDPEDPHSQRLPVNLGSGVVITPSGLVLTSAQLFRAPRRGDRAAAGGEEGDPADPGEDPDARGGEDEDQDAGDEDEEAGQGDSDGDAGGEDDAEAGGEGAEGGPDASVRLATGEIYPARLVGRFRHRVALLALDLPEGVTVPAATLADSRAAIQGELAAVVGRPFADLTLSVGVVSALERGSSMQVASWVHSGHFGGAVVDRYGRLLGVATDQPLGAGRVTASSYLGFAAPLASLLERFAQPLAEHGPPSPLPYGEAEIEARRSAAARVVERTRGSLVNVIVSRAKALEPRGFNPFGDDDEPERTFDLLGQGSGVIIDPSGLSLTNWHVVAAALRDGVHSPDHRVEVTLPTGEKYVANVLSTSRDDDLALIALELEPGQTLVPVELGDSQALRQGQAVFAFGNPLGLANSVSAGIVSGLDIDVRIQGRLRQYKGMLMTDAAINPGNSGGALLDEEGRLVGINSAGRVGAGMAIPVDKAREVFADKLLSAESLRSSYLGLKVAEHDGVLVVTAVEDLSPAARAELEVGDELLAVDEREGLTLVALAQILLEAQPGTPLTLRIGRYGEQLEVRLTPIRFAAWNAYRQSGVLLSEVDYAAESALVHEASIALHRAYTGDTRGRPARLMRGALRVDGVTPIEMDRDHPVRPGDLLLGITTVTRGEVSDTHDLTRFEELADLVPVFDARATREGELCECWLWRDGQILTARVWIRRPPR